MIVEFDLSKKDLEKIDKRLEDFLEIDVRAENRFPSDLAIADSNISEA